MERVQAEIEKADAIQLGKDKALLGEYLEENGIEAEMTEEGLFYVGKQEGKGEKAKTRSNCIINYTLTFA